MSRNRFDLKRRYIFAHDGKDTGWDILESVPADEARKRAEEQSKRNRLEKEDNTIGFNIGITGGLVEDEFNSGLAASPVYLDLGYFIKQKFYVGISTGFFRVSFDYDDIDRLALYVELGYLTPSGIFLGFGYGYDAGYNVYSEIYKLGYVFKDGVVNPFCKWAVNFRKIIF